MDLDQIKAELNSPDSQARLRALTALRFYEADTAVPLLCSRLEDPEFWVRSFVAMGLGRKRSPAGFTALQTLLDDTDANVRAEAASALGLYGKMAIAPMMVAFKQDQHWLVRRSILAALSEMDAPVELFNACTLALEDADITVRETGALTFSRFAHTDMQTAALERLLPLAQAEYPVVRAALARSLRQFDSYRAREMLVQLRQDEDHRVVAAVLEGLI